MFESVLYFCSKAFPNNHLWQVIIQSTNPCNVKHVSPVNHHYLLKQKPGDWMKGWKKNEIKKHVLCSYKMIVYFSVICQAILCYYFSLSWLPSVFLLIQLPRNNYKVYSQMQIDEKLYPETIPPSFILCLQWNDISSTWNK